MRNSFKIYCLDSNVKEFQKLRSFSRKYVTNLCSLNPDHAASQHVERPLLLEYTGDSTKDINWTWYDEALITPKVAEILNDSDINGFELKPVQFHTTLGDEIEIEMYELCPTGWGGMALKESGLMIREECPICTHRVYQNLINPESLFNFESWDGSDVFRIWPLPNYMMITGAMKSVIERHQFSGCKILPLDSLSFSPHGIFSPGNPCDWFGNAEERGILKEISCYRGCESN